MSRASGSSVRQWAATALLPFVLSCTTVSEQLSFTHSYEPDISLEVNGLRGKGLLVAPKASQYQIKGAIKGNFDYLILRTCHRQIALEKVGDEFKYLYQPRAGIEDNRACPLEIFGAEKEKGRNSFGFVDFESEREKLPASLECNGEVKRHSGVSGCSAPVGLIQKIVFDVEVYAAPGRLDCALPEPKDFKTYEFKQPLGKCLVIFQERRPPYRVHRAVLVGFDQTVVRRL
jgi:hypothetical protein